MKKLVVLLFVAALGFSCGGDDETPAVTTPVVQPPALKSIYQLVVDNPNLSTLKLAIEKAELVDALKGVGAYTVFAPNNDAFLKEYGASFPGPSTSPYTKDVLTPILLNHVLAGIVKSSDVKTGYVKSLAPSLTAANKYSVYVNTKTGIVLNGDNDQVKPTVVAGSADISASNGVVHVVNRVILPLTLVNAAKTNESFSKLLGAVGSQADILGALNNATPAAPLTVFAPTDAAFGATATVALLGNLKPEQVKNVLLYHVADGNKYSSIFTTTVNNLATKFTPQTLSIIKNASGKLVVTDAGGNPAVSDVLDVICENGVVHAINAVLVPSNP
jgi:uncharacterized surface protein with fasciclin (FAS1) repeats